MFALPWYSIVFISVPQSILIIALGFALFNLKTDFWRCLAIAVITGIITYYLRRSLIIPGIHTVMIILLVAALLTIINKGYFIYNLAAILLGAMILGAIEGMWCPVFLTLTSHSVEDLAHNSWLNIVAFIPVLLLALGLYVLVTKRKIIVYDLNQYSAFTGITQNKSFVVLFTLLIQCLIILLINHYIISIKNINGLKMLLPWINLIILMIFILVILSIKQLEAEAENRSVIRLLRDHIVEIEAINLIFQAQKHEHLRHIQMIQAMSYMEHHHELKEYINAIAKQYRNAEKMINAGNPILSSMLNSKIIVAESQGIDLAVAIKCDFARLSIPPWDLNSILGNLIDNAMEAAIADKQPRVAIEFTYNHGLYLISIVNNGSNIMDADKIFEAGYTSKGSVSRGYGLFLVKKLLDHYGGEIVVKSGNKTSITVRIPENASGEKSVWQTG